MSSTIILTKGSSIRIGGIWPDGDAGAADLTGYNIEAYDVHENLTGHVTLSITNASDGTWSGVIDWQEDMDDKTMHFRIRLVPTGSVSDLLTISTTRILVRVI